MYAVTHFVFFTSRIQYHPYFFVDFLGKYVCVPLSCHVLTAITKQLIQHMAFKIRRTVPRPILVQFDKMDSHLQVSRDTLCSGTERTIKVRCQVITPPLACTGNSARLVIFNVPMHNYMPFYTKTSWMPNL